MPQDIQLYDLEDDLWKATVADGRPQQLVYSVPEVMVILGRGSKPAVELDLEACARDGVPLLRRRGGGCAVVLDPGDVIVARAIPASGFGENLVHFRRQNERLISGLLRIGIPGVAQDGVSDLVHSDHKVGGTCIYRARGVLLYSASLLVEPRIDLIERYLKHPPREPEYRHGRGHRDFLRGLSEVADSPQLGPELLARRLDEALADLRT